jgi:hypothetical protein
LKDSEQQQHGVISNWSVCRGHSLQSGQSQKEASTQASAATSQDNARGLVTSGSNAQAAAQRSKLQGSRQPQHGQAMSTQHARALIGERGQGLSTQRGRAITAARGQAMIERGQATTGARGQAMGMQHGRAAIGQQPQLALHARQSFRQTARGGPPFYARATASETRESLAPEQRMRPREMARRELPRVSHLPEVALTPSSQETCRLPLFRERLLVITRSSGVTKPSSIATKSCWSTR